MSCNIVSIEVVGKSFDYARLLRDLDCSGHSKSAIKSCLIHNFLMKAYHYHVRRHKLKSFTLYFGFMLKLKKGENDWNLLKVNIYF